VNVFARLVKITVKMDGLLEMATRKQILLQKNLLKSQLTHLRIHYDAEERLIPPSRHERNPEHPISMFDLE
jgi:hypothetical protein